jgi:hypothetical protein
VCVCKNLATLTRLHVERVALRAALAHIARGEIVDGTERPFFSAEQMRAMALAAVGRGPREDG